MAASPEVAPGEPRVPAKSGSTVQTASTSAKTLQCRDDGGLGTLDHEVCALRDEVSEEREREKRRDARRCGVR